MVNSVRVGLTVALLAAAGCLSSASNDYLFSCANGESCPANASCASDKLCHPVFTPGAGPADAGSYVCASASPQCPDGQVCGSGGLCTAVDAGAPDAGDAGGTQDAGDAGETPDAGDAGGTPDAGPDAGQDAGFDAGPPCDLSTAFTAPTSYSCGAGCFSLAVGDFNRDGYNDIVTALDTDLNGAAGVGLFLNGHDGTFGLPLLTRTRIPCDGTVADDNGFATADALAVADFNADGWPDLGLSVSGAGQLALAVNGQDSGFVIGGFQPTLSPICASDSYPYGSIVAFQENGSDWYLGAVAYGFYDTDENSLFVYSRVQSGAQGLDPWGTVVPSSATIPYGMTVQHFDNSPLASVALAENDGDNLGQVEIYRGTTSGTNPSFGSTPSDVLACQPGTTTVSSADLNGDGLLDLVSINTFQNSISVFYAKDGGFRPGVAFSTVLGDAGHAPEQAAIGDFDGDGRADVATVNVAGNITILKGLTDGGFLAVAAVTSGLSVPYWISAVDLESHGANDGGVPDLVVSSLANSGGGVIEVYYNTCR